MPHNPRGGTPIPVGESGFFDIWNRNPLLGGGEFTGGLGGGGGFGGLRRRRRHGLRLDLLESALGQPVEDLYGRHLLAGNVILLHRNDSDRSRVLGIALGGGEWDAIEAAFLADKRFSLATSKLHFHPGKDGELGVESAPGTPNQKFCSLLPAGFAPRLTFSRTAYVMLLIDFATWKQAKKNLTFAGLFRTRKLRLFDNLGNQTSYAWSSNPAWVALDLLIRRWLLARESGGAINQALTVAQKARIDFQSFKDWADFCDADIGGGKKRFEAHVDFQGGNLAEALERVSFLGRAWLLEAGGKIKAVIDQSRSSQLTVTADDLLPGSLLLGRKDLRASPNRLRATLLDPDSGLGPGTISSSGRTVTGVGTKFKNWFRAGDSIQIRSGAQDREARRVRVKPASNTSLELGSAFSANQAAGTKYANPARDYQEKVKEAEDLQHQQRTGRVIAEELDLGAATLGQAERLLKHALTRSLQLDRFTGMRLRPDTGALDLLPGDVLTGFDSQEKDPGITRLWDITEIAYERDGGIAILGEEFDAGIYSDAEDPQGEEAPPEPDEEEENPPGPALLNPGFEQWTAGDDQDVADAWLSTSGGTSDFSKEAGLEGENAQGLQANAGAGNFAEVFSTPVAVDPGDRYFWRSLAKALTAISQGFDLRVRILNAARTSSVYFPVRSNESLGASKIRTRAFFALPVVNDTTVKTNFGTKSIVGTLNFDPAFIELVFRLENPNVTATIVVDGNLWLAAPEPPPEELVLVKNPGFEAGDIDWSKDTGWTIIEDAANAKEGNWVAKWEGTAAAALRNAVFIPVEPGDVIEASAKFKRTAGATSGGRVRISWRDSAQAEISVSPGNTITAASYTRSRVVAPAPASAAFAVIEAEIITPTTGNTIFADQFRAVLYPKAIDDIPDGTVFLRIHRRRLKEDIANPDFEQGGPNPTDADSGWLRSGGVDGDYSYETVSPIAGNRSAKLTGVAGSGRFLINRVELSVQPDEKFFLKATGRVSVAGVIGVLQINFKDKNGANITTPAVSFTETVNTELTLTATAPAGTTHAIVLVYYSVSSTSDGSFIVDKVRIRKGLPDALPLEGRTPGLSTLVNKLTDAGLLTDADQIAADGTTHGRVKNTALTANEIDLSKAGVVGQVGTTKIADDAVTAAKRVAGVINQDIAVNRLWNNWFQGDSGALTGQPAAPNGWSLWINSTDEGTAPSFNGEGELNTNPTTTSAGGNGVLQRIDYERLGAPGEDVVIQIQVKNKSATIPNGNFRLVLQALDAANALIDAGTQRTLSIAGSNFNEIYKTVVFRTTLPGAGDLANLDKYALILQNIGSTNEAFRIRRAGLSRSVDHPRWDSFHANERVMQQPAGGGGGGAGGGSGGDPPGGEDCLTGVCG